MLNPTEVAALRQLLMWADVSSSHGRSSSADMISVAAARIVQALHHLARMVLQLWKGFQHASDQDLSCNAMGWKAAVPLGNVVGTADLPAEFCRVVAIKEQMQGSAQHAVSKEDRATALLETRAVKTRDMPQCSTNNLQPSSGGNGSNSSAEMSQQQVRSS